MTSSGAELLGRSLHPGSACAKLLVLAEPLSFWGGVDRDGIIVDVHHPQCGQSVRGKVVAMPSGRGSSSSTAVLAELIRSGNGPAGILLAECDAIVVIGALVAAEMYSVCLPVIELTSAQLALLTHGLTVDVFARTAPLDATVRLAPP